MEAIQQLKALYLADNRKRYPSLPENIRFAPNYSDKKANGLTRCIIDFIRLSGGQAERISVTGRLIDKSRVVTDCIGRQRKIGSAQWIKPSMQPGTADISATIAGRSVKIEVKCKATNDKVRTAQVEYKRQVELAGGIYLIIGTFEDLFNWYQNNYGNN